MKKFVFVYLALKLMLSSSLQAQVNYKITENNYQKISISFTFGDVKTAEIMTDEGTFSRIYMEGCFGSSHIGEPQLPISVNMIEIPICGEVVLNVYGKDFVIYDAAELDINFPVYPAQPPVAKSQTGSVEFLINRDIYHTNTFYALPLAQFEEIGIMRNINLGELYVSPVQYNPISNEVKVYKSIDVELFFKKAELMKTQIIKDLHNSPMFRPSNIINPMKTDREEFSNTPIKYLIVAHAMFREELDTFMAWKKRKGFLVEIGYTDEENVGETTTSIANFIKSHYDGATPENPAPTFVLLVGDVQQIPAFNGTLYGSHPTDLYYFTVEENGLPWCYYGRFSAQNTAHLSPQIEKTLQYEQFTMPDPNYLNDIVLISGYDNTYSPKYGNGFVNYVTQYYATTAYGYKNIHAHLHPCSSEAAQIRAEIGAGVGIANYTAHGTTTGWDNPAFSNNHISAMNNLNKYGLMIGNSCLTNKFNVNECFGEALLRASGKGAVGYIGSTDNTYWDEDYYWAIGARTNITPNPTYESARLGAYDRLFHTHDEGYENRMTTFGSMMKAGNEAVQASATGAGWKQYYWEIYHLMGDPSVMTYLTKPSPMNAEVPNIFVAGEKTFSAKVAPYSYCALTNSNKELVKACFADAAGNITFVFDEIELGNYEFAAWAQNHIQYFKTVRCAENEIKENKVDFAVYPNPTSGQLTINNEQLTMNNVELYDIYGKKTTPPFGQSPITHYSLLTTINISHLPAGIYFVKIQTNTGEIIKKIIKL